MHIVRLTSLIVAGTWLGAVIASSQQATDFGPTLQLEKPVYVAGESVRFWIGVNSPVRVPEALRSSCVLHWVRPDGAHLDEPVSWTLSGISPSLGWKGGMGLGKQLVSLGRYVLSFEFAGQRTSEQSFEIVANPFSSSIVTRWIFVDTTSDGGTPNRGAVLHVENQTDRVLRFAKPGLDDSYVWLHVETADPRSVQHNFIPQSALV